MASRNRAASKPTPEAPTAETAVASPLQDSPLAAPTDPPAASEAALSSEPVGPNTLCVDVGGTGIKIIVLDGVGRPLCERQRVDTPRPATPASVLGAIQELIKLMPAFDRVSVGFPGVVKRNVVYTAPNLDDGWAGYELGAELEKITGQPTRVLNDAGVQGYGAIGGQGVEMILTLGTGMGCALFINGIYAPNIELAHHPLRKGKTYEEYIDNKTLEEIGRKRWNKRLRRVINQVLPIFNPDVLYLGGGNAKKISGELPAQVKIVENLAGLLGGIALWRY
jgi:polyphosphate glucokinase